MFGLSWVPDGLMAAPARKFGSGVSLPHYRKFDKLDNE